MKLTRADESITDWETVDLAGEMFASLEGLELESFHDYKVQMRATNLAGFTSRVVAQHFRVESEYPVQKGKQVHRYIHGDHMHLKQYHTNINSTLQNL